MRFRTCFAAFACAAAVVLAAPPRARGDEPTADDKREAARAFEGGEKAFNAGDFLRAAELFEQANKKAPHPANTWNAARAYQRLGENARAATLYARYLRTAPPDARDRDAATAALHDLAPKLGRLDVYAPDAKDARIDGKPLEDASTYVSPGSHVISGTIGGGMVTRAVSVEAGASASVALSESTPAPTPVPPAPSASVSASAAPSAAPPAAPSAPPPSTRASWPPVAVAVGGSLTAVSLGFLIASGVDTDNARAAYLGSAKTTSNYQDGLGKEHRTNALVAVTAGLGALTGAAAVIWLIDWRGSPSGAKIGVTPGGARIAGAF